MKKKIIFALVPILVTIIIGFIIYSDAAKIIRHPFADSTEPVRIKVNNGDSLNGLINKLYSEKKIGNSYLIKWYIKKQNLDTNIKPGSYVINKDVSLNDFIKILNEGKYNENAVKVTIPEGYNIEQVAALLQEKEIISKDDFIKSCKEYRLPNYVKAEEKRKYALEGYLFPDTYELVKGMNGKDIIDIMIKNFEKVLKDVEQKINRVIKTEEIDKLIIMASIVEKEAEAANERPVIASVFYNRLKIKMPMQSCATVEYALGVHKSVYTYKDLEIESPYNTYKVKELPIGPVANPGKDSIIAAAAPAQTNYIYFVSKFDGTKTHFFTKDYNEFLRYKKVSDENLAKMNK
ncbi:endolytic transglycosylase MltG [Clostridium sp. SYSU_GA19001]|uniref:endolytic transglycosylase MltG n=1 Tax=Clostridium caldaquaticum TaxID=2940653 RepID=UPI002076ECAF|nr:endolytic transglycosylase MltG [Clostridium caldaquaticum]MCM8710466.1 endolytic transglycosylase MltG [Clostridium caldaquaticum]